MPIDDLYAESTNQYVAGSNQVNVPAPQTPPSTGFGSIAKAVGRGVGQGALQFGGALSDTAAGLSQSYVDPDSAAGTALSPEAQAAQDQRINDALAKQRAGHLFESRVGTAAYDLADTLKPDPTKTTATDQIVQGAVSGLTQLVPSTLLFGPVGGAVAGGASIGMARSEDLKRQGVDVGTRTAVGTVEGALSGAGAVLPVAGSTIARTAGLVAVGGPGLGIAQGVAEKAILRNANYDHLADQIDPLDPTSLAASTLVAGVFAGAHVVATARGAKAATVAESSAAAPKTAPVDVPLTDLPIDTRKALRYNAPQLDAYAAQAAQAAGVPPEMLLFIKNRGEQSNSNQVSPKGAKGVMQFTDPTFAQFGKGDPTDPINSIDAAAAYSKDLLQRYNGDVRAALTEYNGGVKQAEAVHAGGAPTDPETIKYLRKYDQFAATQQINSVKFNAAPDQVDAALVSRGQNIVDDANILPETDVAGMAAHQDAFELASKQMSDGGFPQVSNSIPDDATGRAAYQAFERDVGTASASDNLAAVQAQYVADTTALRSQVNAEMFARARSELTAKAAGFDPNTPGLMVGKNGSTYVNTRGGAQRFHGSSNAIDKLSDDYALAGDNRNIYGQGFYTTDAADISHGYMKKGKGGTPTLHNVTHGDVPLFDMEAPVNPDVHAMLEKVMGDVPSENAETGAPLKNLREIFDEYRHNSKYEGLTRDDVQETFDAIRYNLEQQGYRGYEHQGGHGTGHDTHNVKIFWTPESDVAIEHGDINDFRVDPERVQAAKDLDLLESGQLPEKYIGLMKARANELLKQLQDQRETARAQAARPLEEAPAWLDDMKSSAVEALGPEAPKMTPVESNVRDAAEQAPETPVHLDVSDVGGHEYNGSLKDALELIDNEHAATVDDANLFKVAANCFIATEF